MPLYNFLPSTHRETYTIATLILLFWPLARCILHVLFRSLYYFCWITYCISRYTETYQQFNLESKLPKDLQICDNIELNHILQEYETYYFIRFQKYPKISKKIIFSETDEKKNQSKQTKKVFKTPTKASSVEKCDSLESSPSPLVVLPIVSDGSKKLSELDFTDEKIFKPLGSFEGYSDEWKSFADIIMKVQTFSFK